MDALALWLYLGGAIAGIGLGALAWAVNLLRWPGALALGAGVFALGEGAFMVAAGIEYCSHAVDGECVSARSAPWLAALGMLVLTGALAALAALWPGAGVRRVRLLFAAAALLTLSAVPAFAISVFALASLLPPVVFGWLVLRRPGLRYEG